MTLVTTCERIVLSHQCEKHDGVLIDAQTANVIATIGAALSDENRARLNAMSVPVAARVCWQLIK